MTILEHFINPPDEAAPIGEALCLVCAQAGTCCCRTDPALTHMSFPLSAPEWQRLLPYACLASAAIPAQGAIFDQEDREMERKALALPHDPDFQTARHNERFTAENAAFPGKSDASGSGAERVWGGDAVCAAEPNVPDFIASMRALFLRDKKCVDALFPQNGVHYALRTRADGSCVFLGKNGCRLPRSARPWYCLLFPLWMVEDCLTLFTAEHCLIVQKAHSPAHGVLLLQQHPALIRDLHHSLRLDWGLARQNNECAMTHFSSAYENSD